jgi:Tol biopolymer transport system component
MNRILQKYTNRFCYVFCFGVLIVFSFLGVGCSQRDPVAPIAELEAIEQGSIQLALSVDDTVINGKATISQEDIAQEKPVVINGQTGSVTFSGLPAGTWTISAHLFNHVGAEIYTGTGDAIVTKGQITEIFIPVNRKTDDPQNQKKPPVNDTGLQIVYSTNTSVNIMTIGSGTSTVIKEIALSGSQGANNYRTGNVLVYMGPQGVCEMNLDGSDDHMIYPGAFYPRWSWDGSKIAAGVYGFPNHILVMDPQGAHAVSLAEANTDGHDEYPCWTQDNKIIYRRYLTADQTAAIMIMNADGSDRQVIRHLTTAYVFPTDCSAAGRILFDSSMENYRYNIYSINRDGSGMTNLTSGSSYEARNAKFSADGSKIIFNTYDNEIYMMNTDGSGKVFVTNGHDPYFIYGDSAGHFPHKRKHKEHDDWHSRSIFR